MMKSSSLSRLFFVESVYYPESAFYDFHSLFKDMVFIFLSIMSCEANHI
ncbi:hypothetical protein ABID23_000590 [Bartonella silvatica]|uniref:Uncharacterized protein n=1 Tax=Bartonella silvatica TaxID=357760 RepID=A0ABV2HG39_9HYPH